MFDYTNPSTISKAIAGGLVTALVALAARYGFNLTPDTAHFLDELVTALVAYVVGHAAVFWAPKNK